MTETDIAQALMALGENEQDAKQMARGGGTKGLTQLARAVFLRLAWNGVIPEDNAWIANWEEGHPIEKALKRMKAKGVDQADITDVVRAMQHEVLCSMCELLDGEGLPELRKKIPALKPLSWRLHVHLNKKPEGPIEALIESVDAYDPTGKEGFPRQR
jgi:hypothetical protein